MVHTVGEGIYMLTRDIFGYCMAKLEAGGKLDESTKVRPHNPICGRGWVPAGSSTSNNTSQV